MDLPSDRTKQRDERTLAASGKAQVGIPNPGSPRGVVLAEEARKSRHRLYPVTIVYSGFAAVVLFFGARSNAALALSLAASGLAFWTAVEYWVHRYILHGVFPIRGSAWSRFLNKAFDHLHWQHHLRPWDGNHINGTIFDTLWVVAPAFTLSFLAPVHSVPSFLAGFILGYVIEEWCHHSVHFYVLDWPWFRGLKARHFYHHSKLGAHILFGLSNGFWDDVIGTGMPALSTAPEPAPSIRLLPGLRQIQFNSRPSSRCERTRRPAGCSSSKRSPEM